MNDLAGQGLLVIRNVTRDKLLATRAKRAVSFADRFVGLMGRRALPMGEALLIEPCNSIHTFFMRIPIDVLFLDAAGRVVKRFDALPPWRATRPYFAAASVLELPAGTLGASDTQEGDALEVKQARAD